ncbi:hypothetical protein V8F20_002160 [Naviculisporaceae sp. PSN 640]
MTILTWPFFSFTLCFLCLLFMSIIFYSFISTAVLFHFSFHSILFWFWRIFGKKIPHPVIYQMRCVLVVTLTASGLGCACSLELLFSKFWSELKCGYFHWDSNSVHFFPVISRVFDPGSPVYNNALTHNPNKTAQIRAPSSKFGNDSTRLDSPRLVDHRSRHHQAKIDLISTSFVH